MSKTLLTVRNLIEQLEEIEKEYGDLLVIQDIGREYEYLVNLDDFDVAVRKCYFDKNDFVYEFPSDDRKTKLCVNIGK